MSAIQFMETGKGYPLVLLHGFCETRKIWEHFAERLSGDYRVLCPDLPGFGDSPLPENPFDISDISMQVLGWIQENQVVNPVVVGHSLGGYVALAMAAVQPDRLAGIGLFHSTALADSTEKKENRNRIIDFVQRNGALPFVETFVPGLFHRKDHPAIAYVYNIAAGTSTNTLVAYAAAMRDRPAQLDVLAEFTKPILFVAGEKDTIVEYHQLEEQSKLSKFPFFAGLRDVGHMGIFEDEPGSVKIVKDFMRFCTGL